MGKAAKGEGRGCILAFIDVSGDPFSAPDKAPWICIHCICIRERSLDDINRTVFALKRDILGNELIEIKSTDLLNRSTLSHPALNKYKFLEEIVFRCITHCDCSHASIVFKNTGKNRQSDAQHLPFHYRDILWRIEAICRRTHQENALIIIDNNKRKVDRTLAFAFNNYLYRSSGASALNSILPVPIFADSETTTGLQLADIAAGIIRQYYSQGLHLSEPELDLPYQAQMRKYFLAIKEKMSSYYIPSAKRKIFDFWNPEEYSI